jgi:ATP-dependent Clp protease ATP-binding subunit ClpB
MAGDEYDEIKAAVMESVGQHFRPEFVNRIDEIVVFHPLGMAQMAGIADIQMNRLRQRLHEREMDIVLSPDAMTKLVAVGYDPVYGARPLKRAIQQQIENPLSLKLLAGEFVPGDTIQVDVGEDDELSFSKAVNINKA